MIIMMLGCTIRVKFGRGYCYGPSVVYGLLEIQKGLQVRKVKLNLKSESVKAPTVKTYFYNWITRLAYRVPP